MNEDQLIPYRAIEALPGRRAIVFAPHPDDEVFGCGGTIRAMTLRGTAVSVIVVSDGELGGQAAALGETRRAESREAARILGADEPAFWALPDRGIVADAALIARIVGVIVEGGHDLVLAPSWLELHPDHRATCSAVMRAFAQSGSPARLALYEVGRPLYPNVLVDITPALPFKRQAMALFESQLAERPYDRYVDSLNRYRAYTLGPGVAAAEGFRLLDPTEAGRLLPLLERLAPDGGEAALLALGDELDVLRARIGDAAKRVQAAEDELARMRASRSWRLTAPLRALRRRFRG